MSTNQRHPMSNAQPREVSPEQQRQLIQIWRSILKEPNDPLPRDRSDLNFLYEAIKKRVDGKPASERLIDLTEDVAMARSDLDIPDSSVSAHSPSINPGVPMDETPTYPPLAPEDLPPPLTPLQIKNLRTRIMNGEEIEVTPSEINYLRFNFRGTVLAIITAETAAFCLKLNRNIRKARPENVLSHENSLVTGVFARIANPIAFNADGWMYNGQHRIHACINTGISLPADIRFGVARDAARNEDINVRPRTTKQSLREEGAVDYVHLEALIKMIFAYIVKPGKPFDGSVTPNSYNNLRLAHEDLNTAIRMALRSKTRVLRNRYGYFMAYCGILLIGEEKTQAFFDIADSSGGYDNHPAPVLTRELFNLKDKLLKREAYETVLAMWINAFNHYMRNEGATNIKWNGALKRPKPYPTITGLTFPDDFVQPVKLYRDLANAMSSQSIAS